MSQIDSLSLTKYKKVQYCSIVSMTRRISIRTVAIVALLLPGLVISAPIAGACGLCEDGGGCHLQQPREPSPDTHSCCDTDSETPPETSLGSSNCECGREAPPSLTAESLNSIETLSTTESSQETISPTASVSAAFSCSASVALPPPAPPTYLIDCAFLT